MQKNVNSATEGVIVPIITPLDKNENLNVEALTNLLNFLIDSEVHGIFIGGSAGMGPMLKERTWRELMANAFSIARGKCALMGGIIETSTKRAIQKIKILEKLGYEAIVVTPTFYITLHNHDEFIRHFATCRETSAMRMLAYNIPSCTGSKIPLACLKEMGKRNWIAGFKESSGSKSYFKKALKISRDYGFDIYQGSESDISWSLTSGADGIVPVCANFSPKLFVDAWNSRHNNIKLAQVQAEINEKKLKYVIGDGTKSWLSGVINETSRYLDVSCTAACPLDNCLKPKCVG